MQPRGLVGCDAPIGPVFVFRSMVLVFTGCPFVSRLWWVYGGADRPPDTVTPPSMRGRGRE